MRNHKKRKRKIKPVPTGIVYYFDTLFIPQKDAKDNEPER